MEKESHSWSAKERIAMWSKTRTKIPAGEYHLQCVDAEQAEIWHRGRDAWGKSQKVILWFEVIEGEQKGKVLPAFLAIRESITQGQKYYECWVIANGCMRPRRNRLKDMPISKFKEKVFIGGVVDVKPKFPNGRPKPDIFSYSRVDQLYELLIGNPNA